MNWTEDGTLEPISETSPQDTNGKTDPSSLEHGAATTSLVLPPTSITVSLSESNHRELKVVSNSSSSDDTKEEGIEGAAEGASKDTLFPHPLSLTAFVLHRGLDEVRCRGPGSPQREFGGRECDCYCGYD